MMRFQICLLLRRSKPALSSSGFWCFFLVFFGGGIWGGVGLAISKPHSCHRPGSCPPLPLSYAHLALLTSLCSKSAGRQAHPAIRPRTLLLRQRRRYISLRRLLCLTLPCLIATLHVGCSGLFPKSTHCLPHPNLNPWNTIIASQLEPPLMLTFPKLAHPPLAPLAARCIDRFLKFCSLIRRPGIHIPVSHILCP